MFSELLTENCVIYETMLENMVEPVIYS